jgi:hypothetical protein
MKVYDIFPIYDMAGGDLDFLAESFPPDFNKQVNNE